MNKNILSFIEKYLTKKIGAEIKCCLTFLLILTYYCIFRWVCGFTEAGIIHMLEMVLIGSIVYSFVGHLCGWFDGIIGVCIGFGVYMVCVYLCTFLVYKIKRVIDAKILNNDLKQFHKRRLQEKEN